MKLFVALQVGVPPVFAGDHRVRVVVLEAGADQQRVPRVGDEHLGGEGGLGALHRLALDESAGHRRGRPDFLVEPAVGHRQLVHERRVEHPFVPLLGGRRGPPRGGLALRGALLLECELENHP